MEIIKKIDPKEVNLKNIAVDANVSNRAFGFLLTMDTLEDLLKKGEQGCLKARNVGDKSIQEIRKLVLKYAPEEYDFYMRPIVFTSYEIEIVQSKYYKNIGINKLNLSARALNRLNGFDIKNIRHLLEEGDDGIRYIPKIGKKTRDEIEKWVKESLPKEDYDYYMRNQ